MPEFGRYYEEFEVGEVIKHSVTKTILESDNNLFCLLTMDHNPLHLDKEYTKHFPYNPVVVGTLVFSLVVGFSVADISGKAIANLDYQDIVHHKPVFVGDTLRAETEVLEKRESRSKKDRGIVYVLTRSYNQKDELVLSLKRHVLIPKGNV